MRPLQSVALEDMAANFPKHWKAVTKKHVPVQVTRGRRVVGVLVSATLFAEMQRARGEVPLKNVASRVPAKPKGAKTRRRASPR